MSEEQSGNNDKPWLKLPQHIKKLIAVDAKTRGVNVAADERGIPRKCVGMWIAKYLYQDNPKQKEPKTVHEQVQEIVDSNINGNHHIKLPEFPEWSNDWLPIVQREWIATWRELTIINLNSYGIR